MVKTAASLFQTQGYAATGWRQVIAESKTPWGSQSHHFPDGKVELAVEAMTGAGAGYEHLVRQTFAGGHPADAILAWASMAGAVLEASDWKQGCPVATVALEQACNSEPIRVACRDVFASWKQAISDGVVAAGAEPERAAELATIILASIEGALVLARVDGSPEPLRIVGEDLASRLRAELPKVS